MWRTSLVVLLVAAIGCGAPAEAGNASLAGNAVPSTDYHLNTTNMLIVKFRGGRNYSEVVQLVHDTPGIALVKVRAYRIDGAVVARSKAPIQPIEGIRCRRSCP